MTPRMGMLVVACSLITACGAGGDDASDTTSHQQQAPADVQRATVQFGSDTIYIRTASDSITMAVEVAEREDQRAFGLMDRDQLDINRGMVFLYESLQDGSAGFWMYRTRIPLDIAFFDTQGRIVAIRQMSPCRIPDPMQFTREAANYRPGEPYLGALEVNSGWFRTNGVQVGDRVVVPGRVGG